MPRNLQNGLSAVCSALVSLLRVLKASGCFQDAGSLIFLEEKVMTFPLLTVPPTLSLCWAPTCRDYTWPWKWCSLTLHWRWELWESDSWYILGEGNEPLCFSEKLTSKHGPRFYMRFSQSETFSRLPVLNACLEVFLSTRCILLPVKEVKIKSL